MDSFAGRLAVVTGGGSGMGRELVVQLAAEGCSVAACDYILDNVVETAKLADKGAPSGTLVTAHQCDVADEAQVDRFRDDVVAQHGRDYVNLVFNNAGIGGGGSFVDGSREEWERVFDVDWGGVYNCSRAFVPLLVASDSGYLVNTSSVNGFWAALMPGVPHTAYSTAKFAVKGFSEALITDFRVNAPHVKVAVVMPGHIGTNIVKNSRIVCGGSDIESAGWEEIAEIRADMSKRGLPMHEASDDQIKSVMQMMADGFRDRAPCTAAQAASIILDGVRAEKWRILVGDDAQRLDERVRSDPETMYDEDNPGLGALGML